MIVMDMVTGKRIDDGFGAFEAEVLNAEWLPQPALECAQRGPIPVPAHRDEALDVDAFLRNVYLSQE